MIVTLNDKPHEVPEGTSLQDFLQQIITSTDGMAIAIDYEVIPKSQWPATILKADQKLMLIRAVSGG